MVDLLHALGLQRYATRCAAWGSSAWVFACIMDMDFAKSVCAGVVGHRNIVWNAGRMTPNVEGNRLAATAGDGKEKA